MFSVPIEKRVHVNFNNMSFNNAEKIVYANELLLLRLSNYCDVTGFIESKLCVKKAKCVCAIVSGKWISIHCFVLPRDMSTVRLLSLPALFHCILGRAVQRVSLNFPQLAVENNTQQTDKQTGWIVKYFYRLRANWLFSIQGKQRSSTWHSAKLLSIQWICIISWICRILWRTTWQLCKS